MSRTEAAHGGRRAPAWRVHARAWRIRAAGWSATTRGLLWAIAAGLLFTIGNATMRALTLEIHPMQAMFLRYAIGVVPFLPLLARVGPRGLKPGPIRGQLWRAALHCGGLVLWFLALPHLPLADMTAISFTGPLFIMIGAAWFLREPMSAARWTAVLAGFVGVLVVVGPSLTGSGGWWSLVMLASAPMFAASFLVTKVLTRTASASAITFWQTLLIAVLSLPLALPFWTWPHAGLWLVAIVGGVAGTVGHYCLTRSFASADISATQSVKFVDLVWAALAGWLMFGDPLHPTTFVGGAVIIAAIVLLSRYERRSARG